MLVPRRPRASPHASCPRCSVHKRQFIDVYETVTGTLAGLVSISASCHTVLQVEALLTGVIAGTLANLTAYMLISCVRCCAVNGMAMRSARLDVG